MIERKGDIPDLDFAQAVRPDPRSCDLPEGTVLHSDFRTFRKVAADSGDLVWDCTDGDLYADGQIDELRAAGVLS